jgi:membrane-associated tyrosine/threonine-specific cdc2-inhibitory kinase
VSKTRYGPAGLGSDLQRYQEVRAMRAIPRHDNVVEIHGAWLDEQGCLCILYELCDCNLREYCCQRSSDTLEEDTILSFACDILSGVLHIHRHGYMHLDLKPENLLIVKSGRVKIGDFGLARRIGDTKLAEEGDGRYMAPELLDDRFSPAADIFSIGVSLLEVAAQV